MVDAWLHALSTQTIALAFAVAAVRALQASLLARFGAAAAYVAWLLVPVALAAVALPRAEADALIVQVDVDAMVPAWAATPSPAAASDGVAGALIAALWASGALLLSVMLLQRQRRFEALLDASSGEPRLPPGCGPAVLGLWRRRVVLPRDFEHAFGADERRLMLLHEGVHLRRADNLWNLLAAALLVLHWFNPFAWWAWRRMRVDQETSCDAAVLRRESPEALPTYAGALLKVQGVVLSPPLASSWQSVHPLVERIRMLSTHRISSARHRAGRRLVALSILLAGFGAHALQAGASAPPVGASVLTGVEIRVDAGAAIASKLLTHPGQKATVRYDGDVMKAMASPLELAYSVSTLADGRLQIETTLRQGDPLVALGSPRLITRDGEAARVELRSADGAHAIAVTFVPRLMATKAGAAVETVDAQRVL